MDRAGDGSDTKAGSRLNPFPRTIDMEHVQDPIKSVESQLSLHS